MVLAPPALAQGVVEINQARADAGGLLGDLVADPPGFPVVIHQPGSYRLTGSLLTNQAHASLIRANQVQLDLGGFDVQGGSSQFDCIHVDDPGFARAGISIRNGSTRGCRNGILADAARSSRFVDLRIVGASQVGLWAGPANEVADTSADENGGNGFEIGEESTVRDVSARGNGGHGIEIGSSSQLSGCVSTSNSDSGIRGSNAVLIERCVAGRNGQYGMFLLSEAHVRESSADQNGLGGIRTSGFGHVADSSANDNGQRCGSGCSECAGISVSNESLVEGSRTSENFGAGVFVFNTASRIDGNHATDNGGTLCGQFDSVDGFPNSRPNLFVRNSASAPDGGKLFRTDPDDLVAPVLKDKASTTEPFANFEL